MAKIDVKATVSAPAEINIPLVRGDYHATSNVFRVFFEIFLSFFSATFGAVQSMEKPPGSYWAMLVVFGVSAVAFLGCSVWYSRSSRKL